MSGGRRKKGFRGKGTLIAVAAAVALGLWVKFAERGPVVVTGAAGGVGSVAIALLSRRGFKVIASTGRLQEEPYLRLEWSQQIARGDDMFMALSGTFCCLYSCSQLWAKPLTTLTGANTSLHTPRNSSLYQ